MNKQYHVSRKEVRESNLISDLVFVSSLSTLDLSSKKTVTVVTDKKTGTQITFNKESDANKFLKGK